MDKTKKRDVIAFNMENYSGFNMMGRILIFMMFTFLISISPVYAQQMEFECQLLDTTTYYQLLPDIEFLEPSTIFVTWTGIYSSDGRVFCRESNDLGMNFLPRIQPDPLSPTKVYSSVDIDGSGNPFLSWSDQRSGFLNVRFSKSNDGGSSFLPSVVVDSGVVFDLSSTVKVSSNGDNVFVSWISLYGDSMTTDSAKVYLSRSTDGGSSFLSPQHIGAISDIMQFDYSFDISSGGDTIIFVWEDHSVNTPRLFISASFDSGSTFSSPVNVDTSMSEHKQPSLSLFEDSVYVVYTDDRNSNYDIIMASSLVSNLFSFSYRFVDNHSSQQEEPSITLDTLGNIYVSYRSNECGIGTMTYIAASRNGGQFNSTWAGIFGVENSNSKISVKDSTNIFCVWEYHVYDTLSISVFARSVPPQPPGPPQNLLANGENPSSWDTIPNFLITFVKPYDPSGIDAVFYKLGSPPTGNFDTTGAFSDTSSGDTVAFMIQDTVQGGDPLYVWLMDGRGYMNYNNNSSVLLRYDHTPPSPTIKILPDSASVVTERQPFFQWHSSVDSGGAGIMTYVLVLDTMPGLDSISNFYFTELDTSITIQDSLWDDYYYWAVIPYDSAGNWQFTVTLWDFLLRATHPPPPIAPPESSWVGKNFVITWHKSPDPLAYVDRYFVEVAKDSGFNNIIISTSTNNEQDTTVYINDWVSGDAYWRVRSRNIYNVYSYWSKGIFFRYDSIPPPSPELISPVDSFISDNPRPEFNWRPVLDSQSGLDRYIIRLFYDAELRDTAFSDMAPDTFIIPDSSFKDSTFFWIVISRDRAGNLSSIADTFLLTIDTQAPDIWIEKPEENEELTLGHDLGLVVMSNKSITIDSCYIVGIEGNIMDIDLIRDSTDTDSTLFKSTNMLSGLEEGPAKIYVKGTDILGVSSRDSLKVRVVAEQDFLPEKGVYSWPNPAREVVHFRFYVSKNSDISIDIYKITGKKIANLTCRAQGGDRKSEITWSTEEVGSDIYIFRLQAESIDGSKKDDVTKKFAIVK